MLLLAITNRPFSTQHPKLVELFSVIVVVTVVMATNAQTDMETGRGTSQPRCQSDEYYVTTDDSCRSCPSACRQCLKVRYSLVTVLWCDQEVKLPFYRSWPRFFTNNYINPFSITVCNLFAIQNIWKWILSCLRFIVYVSQKTDSTIYPCSSCNDPFGFVPNPRTIIDAHSRWKELPEDGAVQSNKDLVPIGGMCVPCISVNKFSSNGSRVCIVVCIALKHDVCNHTTNNYKTNYIRSSSSNDNNRRKALTAAGRIAMATVET